MDQNDQPVGRRSCLDSRFRSSRVMLFSGCALVTRQPSIAELKYNPGRYQDRTVAIDGVVTSSWGVPLVPFRLYKVSDGTGELTVVAQDGRTPTRGAHVRVKGRVNDFASFGGAVGRRPHPRRRIWTSRDDKQLLTPNC